MVNDEPQSTDTDLYWLDRRYASIVPVCPDRNVLSAIPALASLLDK